MSAEDDEVIEIASHIHITMDEEAEANHDEENQESEGQTDVESKKFEGTQRCVEEDHEEEKRESHEESDRESKDTVEEVDRGREVETIEEQPLQDELLQMLEDQNKLLESDTRYTQLIDRTESSSNATEDSPVRADKLTSSPPAQPASPTPPPRTPSPPPSQPSSEESEHKEDPLLNTWSELMKNWDEKRNGKIVRSLVRQGIPDPLRGVAWQLLSKAQDHIKKLFPTLITEICPFEKQIQRDLTRTFPEHAFFKDSIGQESLLNVMKAYAVHDKEVGYCQGSLFIAGMLLMHMPEEDAFGVFVSLMSQYKLRELYKPTMADLSLCFYQLETVVEEMFPLLHLHFKALGFHTSMYSSSWFLTMFASSLPLDVAFQVMDIFLVEGIDVIFRLGLALLEHSHDKLLELDLEDMTKHFQKEMKQLSPTLAESLIERAFTIKLSSKKMKKLEKEFVHRREKQGQEKSEMNRILDENDHLYQRVSALERECASLADRLIQGQVTRAQEAEEMLHMQKDVSVMKRKVAELEKENQKLQQQLENYSPSSPTSTASNSDPLRKRSVSVPACPSSPAHLKRFSVLPSPVLSEEENTEQQVLESLGREIHPRNSCPSPELDMLTRELATAKILRAEALEELEKKSMMIRHSLHRESMLKEQLTEALKQASIAEEKLARLQKKESTGSIQLCSNCHKSLTEQQTNSPAKSSNGDSSEGSGGNESFDSTTARFSGLISSLKSVLDSPHQHRRPTLSPGGGNRETEQTTPLTQNSTPPDS